VGAAPPIRGPFRTDDRARAAYAEGAGIYRIIPRGVARPADVADLTALVRWAAETRTPLIPRGAGSGMAGGNVGDGIIVDLNRMAEPPLVVDPDGRRARTDASITLGRLNDAAGKHGLRLPPDPSSGAWATVGGVIGTNAAGPRSLKYGSVRPWVESLRMISLDGVEISLERSQGRQAPAHGAIADHADLIREKFPKVRKSSTGYALDKFLASGDIIDLVIGAEGTLGIVIDAVWRLDVIPSHRSALRLTLKRLEDLGELIPLLIGQGAATAELLDRTFLQMVRDTPAARSLGLTGEEEGVVLVEFEGNSADEVGELASRTSALALRAGAEAHLALGEGEMAALIKLRKSASPILAAQPGRRSLQVVEDGTVPVERLGEYVAAIRKAARDREVEVVIFGHAGDGNLHVNSLADLSRPDWREALDGLYDDVNRRVIELGGVPSGEHGDGRLRAEWLERIYGPEIVELFRQTKESFDPAGIFNPGIKLGGDPAPLRRLKVGSDAAPIPPDIERALREIEVTGGYATDRLELADRVE
jgi:FAD/FMN-containing dehydrogenase